MGQMGWEQATRSAERKLPLSTAQGQGPGTRDHDGNDQGSGSKAKSAGGGAIGTRLPRRAVQAAQRRSVAEGVERWAEELSLALTRSNVDHNHCFPRLDDSLMDPGAG